MTTIDMTLDGGMGAVISKNNIFSADVFGIGMGACKHANGRDWWIIAWMIVPDIFTHFYLTQQESLLSQYKVSPISSHIIYLFGQPVIFFGWY